MPQILHQFDEPLTVARRLHADQQRVPPVAHKTACRRRWHAPASAPPSLPSLCPANSLVASWDGDHIYNHHPRLLSSQRLRPQNKDYMGSNRAFALIQSTRFASSSSGDHGKGVPHRFRASCEMGGAAPLEKTHLLDNSPSF